MAASEKVCPFCEIVFTVAEMKDHIGEEHLGILPDDSDQNVESNLSQSKFDLNVRHVQNIF